MVLGDSIVLDLEEIFSRNVVSVVTWTNYSGGLASFHEEQARLELYELFVIVEWVVITVVDSG